MRKSDGKEKAALVAHGAAVDTVGPATAVAGAGLAIAAAAGTVAASVATGGAAVAAVALLCALYALFEDVHSNREDSHAKLTPYVWSLIDDQPPARPGKPEDLVGPSLYLLREGKAQIDEMRDKLDTAVKKFNAFFVEYWKLNSWLDDPALYNPPRTGFALKGIAAGQRLSVEDQLDMVSDFYGRRNKTVELWNTASAQNGAIFELMRRLNHVANYLQAPMIVARYLDKPNCQFPDCIKDQFEKNPLVEQWRKACYVTSEHFYTYDRNFNTFQHNLFVSQLLQYLQPGRMGIR
jgi:hypothetical protein